MEKTLQGMTWRETVRNLTKEFMARGCPFEKKGNDPGNREKTKDIPVQ